MYSVDSLLVWPTAKTDTLNRRKSCRYDTCQSLKIPLLCCRTKASSNSLGNWTFHFDVLYLRRCFRVLWPMRAPLPAFRDYILLRMSVDAYFGCQLGSLSRKRKGNSECFVSIADRRRFLTSRSHSRNVQNFCDGITPADQNQFLAVKLAIGLSKFFRHSESMLYALCSSHKICHMRKRGFSCYEATTRHFRCFSESSSCRLLWYLRFYVVVCV